MMIRSDDTIRRNRNVFREGEAMKVCGGVNRSAQKLQNPPQRPPYWASNVSLRRSPLAVKDAKPAFRQTTLAAPNGMTGSKAQWVLVKSPGFLNIGLGSFARRSQRDCAHERKLTTRKLHPSRRREVNPGSRKLHRRVDGSQILIG